MSRAGLSIVIILAGCSSDARSNAGTGADRVDTSAGSTACDAAGIDINDLMSEWSSGEWPLVFDEIYAAPAYVTDTGTGEVAGTDWLELYNPSGEAFSLDGVFLMDGDSSAGGAIGDIVDLSRFGSVAPGGRLYLVADGDANGGSSVPIRLNDHGEQLTLQTADETVNASVRYPEVSDACSISRVPDGADSWAVTIPTPDAPNPSAR